MAIQNGQLGLIAEISPRYVNGRLSSLVLMSLSTHLATPFTSVSISALRVACVYAPRHLHASPIGQNSVPRAGRVALPSSQGRINPTPDGPSKAKRPARHRFVPIDPKVAFEGLRRDGADRTYRQFALARGAPTKRTANAVRVRQAGQSERSEPL